VHTRKFKLKWITKTIFLAVTGLFFISSSFVSADSIKLVSMPDFGDVIDFEITSDGQYVVFTADMVEDGVHDLYSIPIGGGTPTKLNDVASENGVSGFMLSPDGGRVAYGIDNNLYSVPVEGPKSASVELQSGGINIGYISISPDSTRVVYPVIVNMFSARELYSIPIGGGEAVRLNMEMVELGSVDYYYIVISPDSQHVVYRADQETFAVDELYSVPIGGPASAGVKLNSTLPEGGDVDFKNFAVSPDSSRVVYVADQEVDEVEEIFSVPITGPATSGVKLNDPLPLGGDVENFKINPDSSSVVYRADQETNDIMELYNVPIKGGSPLKLNHEMEIERGSIGDDVHAFELSPDGNKVVFEASWVNHIDNYPDFGNIFSFNVYELFSVPIIGPPSEEIKLWEPSEKAGYGNGDSRYVREAALTAANRPICEISFNHHGNTVVYRSEYPNAGYCVLWRVPIDGSLPAEKLYNADDSTMPEIDTYQVTKDDSCVVYSMAYDSDQGAGAEGSLNIISDLEEIGQTELFNVPIEGPAEASKKLNGPLITGGSVFGWDLSPHNQVVYKADQEKLDVHELFLSDLPKYSLFMPLLLR
jgi:dipeptidyl aminopeptidase/acylaminoacyl peptidase